jgi:hypothetical protein
VRNRAIAKQYVCTKCNAVPGEPCMGKNGPRLAMHRERYANIPKSGPDAPQPTRRSQRSGYIYAIRSRSANAVKIGFTEGNPYARLKQLQTGAAGKLELAAYFPGTMADEADLHQMFHKYRKAGEWFAEEGLVAQWVDVTSHIPQVLPA